MTTTVTLPDAPFHQHPNSGFAYYAVARTATSADIFRTEPLDAQPVHIATVAFADRDNPDGRWQVWPANLTEPNAIHRKRFHNPEAAALAIAQEDAVTTSHRRQDAEYHRWQHAQAQAQLLRFLNPPGETPAGASL